MNLEEIEAALNHQLKVLSFDPEATITDYLKVYQVLAQVKQAQAAASIARLLDNWNMNGVPVERVP